VPLYTLPSTRLYTVEGRGFTPQVASASDPPILKWMEHDLCRSRKPSTTFGREIC